LIKQRLSEKFALDLQGLSSLPCRWIKGDTPPHIDRGQRTFDNTYLVYLTDGEGQFHVGQQSYPIEAGSGFSFSEGVSHEVVNTNGTSRLLLGPMSEAGFPVGGSNRIEGPGGTTAYIRQDSGSTQYSFDNSTWNTIAFPISINNSNTSAGIFKVYFTSNLELNGGDYFYFQSDKIQVGNESVNADGSRTNILAPGTNYDGLFQNGDFSTNGYNDIYIYNLVIDGAGFNTQANAGWLGHRYFGKGTTNNYIINCSSSGTINAGGGILGSNAENVTLIGCSSSGEIQSAGGGIVGQTANSVTIQQCWSTGAISGNGSGGIAGANCVNADIQKCYSEGIISGDNAGGILGANSGSDSVTISKCYSRGAITGGNSGGICGSLAPSSATLTVTITNCYSAGNLNNTDPKNNGCICGLLLPTGSGTVALAITNCYTEGTVVLSKGYMIANVTTINGSQLTNPVYTLTNNFSEAGSSGGSAGIWNDTNASSVLTGEPSSFPGVGSTWASTALNTAYELANLGATPYQTQTISDNALIQTYVESVEQGSGTVEALVADASGNNFRILDKSGGTAASYASITISAQTGKISTTSQTAVGTYTLSVRSIGSYYITTFVLRVTAYVAPSSSSEACCASTMDERGLTYEEITSYRIGNRLLLEVSQNSKTNFDGYSDYVKYKMAQGSRKF
jgi:hypothetical protein